MTQQSHSWEFTQEKWKYTVHKKKKKKEKNYRSFIHKGQKSVKNPNIHQQVNG